MRDAAASFGLPADRPLLGIERGWVLLIVGAAREGVAVVLFLRSSCMENAGGEETFVATIVGPGLPFRGGGEAPMLSRRALTSTGEGI